MQDLIQRGLKELQMMKVCQAIQFINLSVMGYKSKNEKSGYVIFRYGMSNTLGIYHECMCGNSFSTLI